MTRHALVLFAWPGRQGGFTRCKSSDMRQRERRTIGAAPVWNAGRDRASLRDTGPFGGKGSTSIYFRCGMVNIRRRRLAEPCSDSTHAMQEHFERALYNDATTSAVPLYTLFRNALRICASTARVQNPSPTSCILRGASHEVPRGSMKARAYSICT